MTKADSEDLVARISRHSLRAGYATVAAAMDVPELLHSAALAGTSRQRWSRYFSETDNWTKNGLKGDAF
jgi:hypothetical protein